MKNKHTIITIDKIEHIMIDPLGPELPAGVIDEFQRRMTEAIHDAFHVPIYMGLDVSTATDTTALWLDGLDDLIEPEKKSEPKSEFKSWPYAQD